MSRIKCDFIRCAGAVVTLTVMTLLCGVTVAQAQARQARHGMTSGQYKAVFDQMTSNGYRLVQVDGYDTGSGSRYAAIWVKKSGPARVARHGMTSAQYQSAFNTYTNQGYRLVLVDGYRVGNAVRYAAIWEKSGGGAWVARHGMSSAQYQSYFNKFTSQGYRLAHVSGNGGSSVGYAAIWTK